MSFTNSAVVKNLESILLDIILDARERGSSFEMRVAIEGGRVTEISAAPETKDWLDFDRPARKKIVGAARHYRRKK